MVERDTTQAAGCEITPVITVLEEQLAELDRIDALLAAAHLDSAIQQLRIERVRRLHSEGDTD